MATDHEPTQGILGRKQELARLDLLVADAAENGPKVLVVTGEPGVGKSALVEWTAERGRTRGMRVLRVRGSESEADLCFSAAHQLLRPLLPEVDRLAEPGRGALRSAFGLPDAEAGAVDPLHLRIGVTNLLADAAAKQPLLLLIDDAQWVDAGSLDIVSFVARRLAGQPIVLLVAAREESVPERFDRDFPHLVVEPLDHASAGSVLDAQPHPPRGRMRARILQESAGVPLALIELARAVAGERGADVDPERSLPLTKRLEKLFAADLPAFPPPTRRALLLLAAADTTGWTDIARADPDLEVDAALRPAEGAGLVRVEGGHAHWRHPLVRSAVYQAASFSERRQAHLALAAALTDEPDRRAWHLAAAALGQDEEVAAALAGSAERSQARGGHAAAAAALERAAELTPDPEVRAARLLGAAVSAMFAGYPQWVGDLAGRVPQVTRNPVLRAQAALSGGWALGVTLRHDEALALLFSAAEGLSATDPAQAAGALSTAATSVYNSGDPFYQNEFQRLWEPVSGAAGDVEPAWPTAAVHPHTRRLPALEALRRGLAALATDSLSDLVTVGAAAWILDETDTAVRLLGAALDHLRRAGTAGMNATVSQALALALFESGGWAAARSSAEDAFRTAAEGGADNVTVGSRVLQATLRALAGDHETARVQALEAVRDVDLRASRSLHVRYRHALGMAAVAAGDHVTAYEQLRSVFTRDFEPVPIHYHASVYYLGDLAWAAVRADRAGDARIVAEAVDRRLGAERSPRLQAIVHRAMGLLSATDAEAESRFRMAIQDPACTRWPFEHALVQLDFGEWLRRRRRAADARPHLVTALEIFERLDARPWLDRAAAELRAAGAPAVRTAAPDSAADLTSQEVEIAELAAQGLTNRDIAARLHLSPRTVGYHLHKIFPKLGISARAQLRDALTGAPRSAG